jgi:hypothetical protein
VLRGTSKDYTKAGDVYAFGMLQVELLLLVSLLASHHADTSMIVTVQLSLHLLLSLLNSLSCTLAASLGTA